ncbi:Na+/H+ antiporter NhaA [Arcanobacterium buesumense]|uniref:Na(+)/H(+) antiporter NhaA n=1 Tax=Arcanobacterium buesumense TaxID=2722751 RepID=A0A6H2EMX4_9ACTO|nr:Na+/H+ antiporter NhaA [Arcanobacterium buesumense]QJC22402.1 Na+/H+ antiporter NhaA [Arcanobacterium buesumense]
MPHRPSLIARYRRALQNEATAGIVLILGALIALIWANSPLRESYMHLSETVIGPQSLHLGLPLSHWAADGLLAIFFFVVGLELKHEFVAGSLRDIKQALVPILAAVCGMIGPVAVYSIIQVLSGSTIYDGWAVPVATDIAFALAVLGVFGKGFPPVVRTFLMTLAVVDDLLGIVIIAVFFSDGVNFLYLGLALIVVAIFGFLVQQRIIHWYLLWPLGIIAWYFMHLSGVHATIAGVALGMTVPALMKGKERKPLTEQLAERINFYSAGFILPIFAFFAAGVNVIDSGGFGAMLVDPVSMGIYLGLPLGKFLGIFGGVVLMIKVFRLKLGHGVDLPDIFAISWVAGIGFTVSLLIATLSFAEGNPHGPHARVAVILGSLLSLILGALFLIRRARQQQRGAIAKRPLHTESRRLRSQPTKRHKKHKKK